jgi:hypothetical protein
MREKQTNTLFLFSLLIMYGSSYMFRHYIAIFRERSLWRSALRSQIDTHHVTRHNTHIHNILSTAPHLSISHKHKERSLKMAI